MRQRLGLEHDYESHIFRRGTHFFHIENWYSVHALIRWSLRLAGLHGRGRRNALDIRVREHEVTIANLPTALDGYRLLQLSDLHVDLTPEFVPALIEAVRALRFDLPVPYFAHHPVAYETEQEDMPEGAGRAWLYVEPDGDVLPAQGMSGHVLGILLTDPWSAIYPPRA